MPPVRPTPAEVDSNYVSADELGAPVHPEHYSDEFHRLAGGSAARSACMTPRGTIERIP